MKNLYFAVLHSLGFTHKKLRDITEDVEGFYKRLDTKILLEAGFQIDKAQIIVDKMTPKNVERVEHILRELQVNVVHIDDAEYPSLLRILPDAPTILYVR